MNHANDVFEKYFREHYRHVVGYIHKKINNLQEAEDIAMDCFTACYYRLDTFDESKASFATWLYAVVNNRIKNYYRDIKETDLLPEDLAEDMESDWVQAEYLSQMRRELADALKGLPELQRKIVIYKYFYEMNSPQIAAAVGIEPGNVRVLLSRAVKKLNYIFSTKNLELEM